MRSIPGGGFGAGVTKDSDTTTYMIPSSTLLQLKDSFVDYSFDRAKSLINSQYESSAIWCLGGDLWGSTTTSNMTLPKYDEIVQGHNGDCFLVASIAALLAVNFDFTQIVSSKEKGKYEVKIFSEGGERGEVVIIDGLIPCGVGVGAIFAHSRNGDMSCFGVIEKVRIVVEIKTGVVYVYLLT